MAADVHITVLPGPRRHPGLRLIGYLVALTLAVAGLAPYASVGGAAAGRYPLRCLSVAIALHDPRFARSAFDRAIRCS